MSISTAKARLEQILSSLSHLNLKDDIIDRQDKPIRCGGSCDVFIARSKNLNKKVAVKRIRVHLEDDEAFAKQICKEIRIWEKMLHKNVLPLIGFMLEGSASFPNFVSEWMDYGVLPDYMKAFPRASAETRRVLFGVAAGLAYLHNEGVIHADLKGRNILVSPNKQPLLADFGLSRMLVQSQVTSGSRSQAGTVRWTAKELILDIDDENSKCNMSTDIWAFGMVIYELLSGAVPYHSFKNDFAVARAIGKGKLPENPPLDVNGDPTLFNSLWELSASCWVEYSSRPSAIECLQRLFYLKPKPILRHSEFIGGLTPIFSAAVEDVDEGMELLRTKRIWENSKLDLSNLGKLWDQIKQSFLGVHKGLVDMAQVTKISDDQSSLETHEKCEQIIRRCSDHLDRFVPVLTRARDETDVLLRKLAICKDYWRLALLSQIDEVGPGIQSLGDDVRESAFVDHEAQQFANRLGAIMPSAFQDRVSC
ncbi:kinase-like protein [Schizopora paradoxa]|uniref:Kinase-like protein n=1 Tax=Schizopora paradoxa TaxID=27342 RepID=A0A0H2S2S5_9AGAM|nr:kinase-like protein [Schizopora paradoxa]